MKSINLFWLNNGFVLLFFTLANQKYLEQQNNVFQHKIMEQDLYLSLNHQFPFFSFVLLFIT